MRTEDEKEQPMQPQNQPTPAPKNDGKTDEKQKSQETPFRFTDWASL